MREQQREFEVEFGVPNVPHWRFFGTVHLTATISDPVRIADFGYPESTLDEGSEIVDMSWDMYDHETCVVDEHGDDVGIEYTQELRNHFTNRVQNMVDNGDFDCLFDLSPC